MISHYSLYHTSLFFSHSTPTPLYCCLLHHLQPITQIFHPLINIQSSPSCFSSPHTGHQVVSAHCYHRWTVASSPAWCLPRHLLHQVQSHGVRLAQHRLQSGVKALQHPIRLWVVCHCLKVIVVIVLFLQKLSWVNYRIAEKDS